LFGDIESLGVVGIVVSTTEKFAQDWVVSKTWNSIRKWIPAGALDVASRFLDAFRFDMPAGEVVLENTYKSFFGIIAILSAIDPRPSYDM